MYNVNITLRGTLFEAGKKVPAGQKKQYLHIEGDNKYYVELAYKEIKRAIEEFAMKNLTLGNHPGAQSGRYKVV